ncbi:hypothetical protein V8G54_033728 [Vigna mungo]|uniref:Phosphoglycolate phosphatase n=1 Tax=Vigna mungo TaxID=3915 RepID=A0AAQ3MPG2_VIGMU
MLVEIDTELTLSSRVLSTILDAEHCKVRELLLCAELSDTFGCLESFLYNLLGDNGGSLGEHGYVSTSVERYRNMYTSLLLAFELSKRRSESTFHPVSSSAMSSQPLSPNNFKDLFDSVEAFLFDCDGVIWKGDELIQGVPQTLQMLRSKGKKLVFVTNNSWKSRSQYAQKFQSLGISVSQDEIFSSSFAAAMYLKAKDFPSQNKVYVIGGEGILEELQLAGIAAFGGPASFLVHVLFLLVKFVDLDDYSP